MDSKSIKKSGFTRRTGRAIKSASGVVLTALAWCGMAQAQSASEPAATTLQATTPQATTPQATTPQATTPQATTPSATGVVTAPAANATTPAQGATSTAPSSPAGTPDASLTLEDTILIALRQHGDIGAAQQNFISAREGITSARSGLYPSVSANLGYDYQNNNSSTRRTTTTSGTTTTTGGTTTTDGTTTTGGTTTGTGTTTTSTGTSFSTSNVFSTTSSNISVSQNLFDAGRTKAQIKQAKGRELNAVGGVGGVRSSLAYRVAQGFYEQLRQEKLVAQRQGQVALAQQQLAQIQAQVEAGVAARVDVQSVQVNLSQARFDLATAQTDLRTATVNLRDALGLGRGPALRLRESAEVATLSPPVVTPANLTIPTAAAPTAAAPTAETPAIAPPEEGRPLPITVATPPPPPVVPDLAALDTFIAEARRLRSDLVQARSNVQISEASVTLSKIQSRPQITASAGYDIDPRSSSDRGFTFGAGISIPIFDAGGRKADVRASQASLEADKIRLAQLEKDVEADVEASYVSIAGEVDRISNARDLVEAARINLETAVERYRAGLGIVLDIVNAQTQLFNAQTSSTQAVYDYELARSDLDRAVGRFAWADPGQAPPVAAPTTLAIPARNKK